MIPSEAIEIAKPHLDSFHGGWKKMNVYDQGDPNRITAANNRCVGCAVANVFQSQTNRVGLFDRRFYEGAKRRRSKDDPRNTSLGISFPEVLDFVTDEYGGSWHQLDTEEEILSWIIAQGPVAMGCKWREGMRYPVRRGWNPFGKSWCSYNGARMGNHALAIMGMSYKQGGYVTVQNSYGRNWGNGGIARLPKYEFLKIARSLSSRFYGLTNLNTG